MRGWKPVLVDLASETERGFRDEPSWLPIGGVRSLYANDVEA